MTQEEFEELKAREREHLEKLRELKRAVGQLERQRSVADALTRLQTAAQDLIDRNTDLVDDIARETAFLEARSELAMEGQQRQPAPPDVGVSEEELQRLRAQKLIEEIKQQTSSQAEDAPPDSTAPRRMERLPEEPRQPAPDKTIGRMR